MFKIFDDTILIYDDKCIQNIITCRKKCKELRKIKGKAKLNIIDKKDFKNISKKYSKMEGGNFFKSATDFIKYGVDKGLKIIKNIPHIFKGKRNNYPPYFRDFIKNYGDKKILKIEVCKNPISSVISGVLDLISLGKFSENKKALNYDDMFHLYLLIYIEGEKLPVRLEKNHVLSIGFESSTKAGTCIPVNINVNNNLTINNILDITLEKIGPEMMFQYDGINNNCQIFLKNILKSNGLYNDNLNNFIMQDTDKVVGTLETVAKNISKGATDIAGYMDLLIYGEGCNNVQCLCKNK